MHSRPRSCYLVRRVIDIAQGNVAKLIDAAAVQLLWRVARGRATEQERQMAALFPALLHIATHEIGSHLAFCLQDLDTVRQGMAIRAAYPQYTDTQFSEMAREGWSLQRVKRMHEALPAISLAEHSLAIRTIHACVSALPKLAHDRLQA